MSLSRAAAPLVVGRERPSDIAFMRQALALGERNLGRTAPNPTVGAVLVDETGGRPVILARAVTAPGGRPHAERLALDAAGEKARGATLFVTLEPCAHHGKTPPCAEAVVAAGVTRVVCGLQDPDLRVAGKGFALLREAGIELTTGVIGEACRKLHAGHVMRVTAGRPYVTLKLAMTQDGFAARALAEEGPLFPQADKGANDRALASPRLRGEVAISPGLDPGEMAGEGLGEYEPASSATHPAPHRPSNATRFGPPLPASGERKRPAERLLITGAIANAQTHLLRARSDAILVGVGTVLADDPELTCRLPGLWERSPLRVVLDANLRTPPQARLVSSARETPSLILTAENAPRESEARLSASGVEIMRLPSDEQGFLDLEVALRALAARGVTLLLCEGGPKLAEELARRDLVDEAVLITGARPLGEEGVPALGPALEAAMSACHWLATERLAFGDDRWVRYERSS